MSDSITNPQAFSDLENDLDDSTKSAEDIFKKFEGYFNSPSIDKSQAIADFRSLVQKSSFNQKSSLEDKLIFFDLENDLGDSTKSAEDIFKKFEGYFNSPSIDKSQAIADFRSLVQKSSFNQKSSLEDKLIFFDLENDLGDSTKSAEDIFKKFEGYFNSPSIDKSQAIADFRSLVQKIFF